MLNVAEHRKADVTQQFLAIAPSVTPLVILLHSEMPAATGWKKWITKTPPPLVATLLGIGFCIKASLHYSNLKKEDADSETLVEGVIDILNSCTSILKFLIWGPIANETTFDDVSLSSIALFWIDMAVFSFADPILHYVEGYGRHA